MFFAEPPRTQYDLNFPFMGFPVRVHPLFFIMPVLLGSSFIRAADLLGTNAGVVLLVVIAVFFISILVHELGHAVAYRYFGQPARILLYWLGGLAIADSGNSWSSNYSSHRIRSNEKIIISLAGPFFGFCLAGLLIALVYAIGGRVQFLFEGLVPWFIPVFPESFDNPALRIFFLVGIWANVFWNLLNLVPVFPLDGGQVARELFVQNDSINGGRNSVFLSVFAGGFLAVIGMLSKDFFLAILFGYLAFMNYQSIQGYGGRPW